MSSSLVRQALAFVDGEETKKKNRRWKATAKRQGIGNQGYTHPYQPRNKKITKEISKPKEAVAAENIKKLLSLSKPVANKNIAEKIVERAVKGKPLTEKIVKKTESTKSILFPEESYKNFEKEYFCS